MEASNKSSAVPMTRRRSRRRRLIAIIILALVAWRAWPLAAAASGWNLRGALVAMPPSGFFLPPARTPDEIRSGMAHPGFDFPRFASQALFCPRAMRHGHAFWCKNPALPADKAARLAEILADAATYEPWFGEKACGGFHADWYLRWGEGDERREVVLCEGCHEALVYYAGGFIRCDLSKQGYEKISAITGAP